MKAAIALSLHDRAMVGDTSTLARSCVVTGDGLTLEAGTIEDLSEPEPGWITEEAGHRMNIHHGDAAR